MSKPKKYRMIHDENLCIGCQSCSIACRSENEVPMGVYRLQVPIEMKGRFPNLRMDFRRQSCVMCDNSPCVTVCPTGASFKTEDGISLVDSRTCVSCKYCIMACPYDARFVNPITKAIDKCTWCHDTRLVNGEEPACVSVCPTDALVFGDANDANSEIAKALNSRPIVLPKEHLGTKPKLGFVTNRRGGNHE